MDAWAHKHEKDSFVLFSVRYLEIGSRGRGLLSARDVWRLEVRSCRLLPLVRGLDAVTRVTVRLKDICQVPRPINAYCTFT